MKLGVNSDVNIEQKPLRIKHNLGPSKVNHYNQKAKSPKKSEETKRNNETSYGKATNSNDTKGCTWIQQST